jgi:hypothetical protein
MRTTCAAALLLLIVAPVSAHRLDEYLQATTIALEKNRAQIELRLTPGVSVFRAASKSIDTDADGVISTAEQLAYAQRVRSDLVLRIDGEPAELRVVSFNFPKLEQLHGGVEHVLIEFEADLPQGASPHELIFENHHQTRIATYLVNALAPRDPEIQIVAQNRNHSQSVYRLDYVKRTAETNVVSAGVPMPAASDVWWRKGSRWWIAPATILFLGFGLFWRRRTSGVRRVSR